MKRILMAQLLVASMFVIVVGIFHGNTFATVVEIATGPDELLQMEQQGKVTVRALRGWGRLPDTYMKLAQQLRQQGGLDLLGADLEQLRAWIAQAMSGDAVLSGHLGELESLANFMDGGEHLDWSPVEDQSSLPEGALVRQEGKRWTHTPGAPVATAAASPQPSSAVPASALTSELAPPADPAQATEPPSQPAPSSPVASSGTQGEGQEFPIYEDKPGTYRARLVVDGLQSASGGDELYFQQQEPSRWLETKRIKDMENEDLSSSNGAWSSDAPYEVRVGFAQVGTPISIRVEAPESPVIELTEQESKDNVRYEITGREYRFLLADSATGDVEIGFQEDKRGEKDGSVSWTPQLDPGTGRPVGPRAIGVYMAYKIKKFIGTHEFGRLRADFRRIGWVVIAMPGDIYSDGLSLFAVGQEKTLAGAGAEPNWTWPVPPPEKFAFELPDETLKKMEVKLSEDIRKVAWVEGAEGRQRVLLNGVPGKWYNEVPSYMMRFSMNGESFCFRAELGDLQIPVFNGAEGPVFEDLEDLRVSEDGAHTLAVGHVGAGVYRVYLNGIMIRETSDRIRKPVLAVDGTAAWIESDKGGGGERVFTSAGYEGPIYTSIIETPKFTTRRVELYYIAEKDGDKRYLVRNGEELKPTMGTGYKFTVTPDSAYYAYVAQLDTVRSMVINGQIGPDFTDIWDPATFSVDGQHHVYSAKKDKEAFLVVDGQIFSHGFGALKNVLGETFSPDGSRWAAGFQLNDEEYFVVVDGKEIGRGQGSPRRIVFSPDGTRVAWLEKQKKSSRIYLDGQAGPEARDIYDEEPPQFSPDGRHLVYFTRDSKEKKMHIVVFGGEDRVHDIIPPRAMFVKGGLEYLAIDGTQFRRESISLE